MNIVLLLMGMFFMKPDCVRSGFMKNILFILTDTSDTSFVVKKILLAVGCMRGFISKVTFLVIPEPVNHLESDRSV